MFTALCNAMEHTQDGVVLVSTYVMTAVPSPTFISPLNYYILYSSVTGNWIKLYLPLMYIEQKEQDH